MTDANSPHFWDSLYQTDQFHWDLGGPTPVFQQLAESRLLEPGRMLVMGAGRGHDARLFARHGFAVTAVDFSAEAIVAMKELANPTFPIEIIQADFFSLPSAWNGQFDIILDYTSFCAVLPQRRQEYADLVSRLLKPKGKYIILAFPISNHPGGPPYAVQAEAIIELFADRDFSIELREFPTDSVASRKGYEELLILRKR
jgi:SAM-dependent methyltransferase